MAPSLRPRQSLAKDKFSAYFGGLKSTNYHDPSAGRGGGGSNKYVPSCLSHVILFEC